MEKASSILLGPPGLSEGSRAQGCCGEALWLGLAFAAKGSDLLYVRSCPSPLLSRLERSSDVCALNSSS